MNDEYLTPQRAKERFGATHYITMRDGVTPQMFYKLETTRFSDGTAFTGWVYLSFANLWMGSNIRRGSDEEKRLVEIAEVNADAMRADAPT